ncbi:hypothetical protein RDWZM_010230 [Blomia tropicalis]|uniref:Protein arginine methyltransferase NDUFAF7 n=1 Tax=Blomia tropicalis TaxID=40697 RepID=A0A9Q0LY32_BLOTA|nr:hypothetical protein RDWZM_010230 [Blomia tropicalis]
MLSRILLRNIYPCSILSKRHLSNNTLRTKISSTIGGGGGGGGGGDQPESPLLYELARQIRFNGPMTVHDYMKTALTHPQHGFYMKSDVFGSSGHFTTSPEVSQLFGELMGIWILHEWLQVDGGTKRPLRIVELGPGRGTLTSDIARVMSQFEMTKDCCQFFLIEISTHLQQIQEKQICKRLFDDEKRIASIVRQYQNDGQYRATTHYGQPITWYQHLDRLSYSNDGFTVFIANEFFDALPIYKFVKLDNKWREMLIDIDAADIDSTMTSRHSSHTNRSNGKLRWIRANRDTPATKMFANQQLMNNYPIEGEHLEICPQTIVIIENIVRRINRHDGCLLICDYGYDSNDTNVMETSINRDTFRAYRHHKPIDPLQCPGMADLTADVDFSYIRHKLSSKANVYGTVSQSHFLRSLGIEVRLQKLNESTTNETYREELNSGANMLLNDMGQRFKLMAIFGKTHPKHLIPFAFDHSHLNDDNSSNK